MMILRNFNLTLLLVFVSALLIRLAYFLLADYDLSKTPDTSIYIEIANGILQSGDYVKLDKDGVISPATERVPGYPIFLAINKIFFGDSYLISSALVQIILDSLTCVIIVLIAKNINKVMRTVG